MLLNGPPFPFCFLRFSRVVLLPRLLSPTFDMFPGLLFFQQNCWGRRSRRMRYVHADTCLSFHDRTCRERPTSRDQDRDQHVREAWNLPSRSWFCGVWRRLQQMTRLGVFSSSMWWRQRPTSSCRRRMKQFQKWNWPTVSMKQKNKQGLSPNGTDLPERFKVSQAIGFGLGCTGRTCITHQPRRHFDLVTFHSREYSSPFSRVIPDTFFSFMTNKPVRSHSHIRWQRRSWFEPQVFVQFNKVLPNASWKSYA